MKTTLALLALCLSFAALPATSALPPGLDPEAVREAGQKAVRQAVTEILATPGLPRRLTVLPLAQDLEGDYFTESTRAAVARQGESEGFQVFTRESAEWSKLLAEIRRGDQYGDTMDAATIQQFGRVQGVQAILLGRIESIGLGSQQEVRVRLTLKALEVETGRLLRAVEQSGLAFAPMSTATALVEIPETIPVDTVRTAGAEALRAYFAEFFALPGLPRKFAVLPFWKDIEDRYFTEQARNLFASSGLGQGYEIYTRMDEEWPRLLSEIYRSEQLGGSLVSENIQKLGRLQGVDALLLGRVTGIEQDRDGLVRVRLILQAFEVETGRLLWGAEKIGSATPPNLVRVPGLGQVLPGSREQWLAGLVIAGASLLALGFLFLMLKKASRPR